MPDIEALRAVESRLAAGEKGRDVDYSIDAAFNSHRGFVSLNRKLAGDTPPYTTSLDAAVTLFPGGLSTGCAQAWDDVSDIESEVAGNPAAALTLIAVRARIAMLEKTNA